MGVSLASYGPRLSEVAAAGFAAQSGIGFFLRNPQNPFRFFGCGADEDGAAQFLFPLWGAAGAAELAVGAKGGGAEAEGADVAAGAGDDAGAELASVPGLPKLLAR
jgi:hypothetical protein